MLRRFQYMGDTARRTGAARPTTNAGRAYSKRFLGTDNLFMRRDERLHHGSGRPGRALPERSFLPGAVPAPDQKAGGPAGYYAWYQRHQGAPWTDRVFYFQMPRVADRQAQSPIYGRDGVPEILVVSPIRIGERIAEAVLATARRALRFNGRGAGAALQEYGGASWLPLYRCREAGCAVAARPAPFG